MDYYLVTTSHLESATLFRENADFIVGMNAVPLIAAYTGVVIVAFILMSNHVHFILYCTYSQALDFINGYKKHYSFYLAKKYGIKETLRRNSVDIQKLDQSGESLERAIAYVQMNPVAANICLNPFDYPWGTGNCYFKVSTSKGIPIDNLSARSRHALFHSRKEVPRGLLVGESGFILPESYIQKGRVEAIFRSPNRMQYFLNSSSKAKIRLESKDSETPSLKDTVVLPLMLDLCQKMFGKGLVNELTPEQLTELLRQLRYRCSSNINQLARITGLSYTQIAKLLE